MASVLCASLAVAQQPPAPAPNSPPPEVVFSVTTALVQVDAVVTDSKGHYVTDLAADDFAVYEDGKPQKITNFSYVQVSPQALAEPKSRPKHSPKSAPVLPSAPSAPPRREDIRRTIVLIVDDLGLSFESMAFVRYSLRKFVERQMQPRDLLALCRTASGSGTLFTVDKRILLSLIDGLRWNASGRLALFEPCGKYSKLAMQSSGRGHTAGRELGPRSYDVRRNTIFAVGTLGAIVDIVDALREMPGRKSIVLFSDGIQADMGSGSEIVEAMRKLMDRANRAGTVIYTMHTAGLQPLQLGAEDRVDLTPDSGYADADKDAQMTLNAYTHVGMEGRDVAFNKGQQGLASLALETGGVPYENGNDLNWGLKRVLEDQQGYYLIGFKPPSTTFDEKHGSHTYHRITIKVNRPGLHVRSRSGFFGETDDQTLPKYETPLDQMRAAMLSPFRSSGVRLRLTALYAEIPKRGPVVRNLVHIDTQDLTFQPAADGSAAAHVEIVAVATGMGDLPVATIAQSYTFQAAANRVPEALKQGVVYTLDVPVKKRGAYQIHVAVRDAETGKVGSASQFLEIPDLKHGRLALTSIVLQSGDRPAGTPAYGGMSPATRQFRPGGEVEYFCVVENAGKKVPAADLDSQIRIVRDGKDVYTGPAKLVPIDGGGLAVTGRLKLSERMTPGDYFLEVIAADRTVRKNGAAAQWTDFEIVP